MTESRDTALSFHWQTDPDALSFLGAPAFDTTVRSIVTQAWLVCRDNPDRWISYSRNKNSYRRSRYRLTTYTYTTVMRAIALLAGEGWLEHRRVPPGNLGWQSSFRASPRLMAAMAASAVAYNPAEVLILRDREGGTGIEYRDTRETHRLRRSLIKINEALASIRIAHPDLGEIRIGSPTKIGDANPGPARQALCRIFTDDFGHHGRFYGGFWQGMNGNERARLTIDGHPVCEPDFRALHATLLYDEAGGVLDGDPYDITGFPRKLVKIAFNTMVNARSRKGGAWSVMLSARGLAQEGKIPEGFDSMAAVSALFDAIEARHSKIGKSFYSDAGLRLMRRDSDMAESVMLEMAQQGVAVLSIHDSFVAPAKNKSALKKAMQDAFEKTSRNANRIAA